MKEKIKDLLDRLQNVGTFVSAFSLVILLINQFIEIDLAWFDTTINIIASLGVATGILNNPSGNFKPYIPLITEPKIEELSKKE